MEFFKWYFVSDMRRYLQAQGLVLNYKMVEANKFRIAFLIVTSPALSLLY